MRAALKERDVPVRNSAADALRSGLYVAASQLSSSADYSEEGCGEPARLAALQGFEKLRLTLRDYSTSAEILEWLDHDQTYPLNMEDRPEAPATILDTPAIKALVTRCERELKRCEALPAIIRGGACSWLGSLAEGEAMPSAVLPLIGACEVAIAALRSKGR